MASTTPSEGARAQAVRCGERAVAWPHGVARAALDRIELSAVPNAPPWLAGATNIDGRIVPVIDLVAWFEPGHHTDVRARDTRLLVLGDGEETTGLLFTGLPRLVRVGAAPALAADDPLAPLTIGAAEDDPRTVVIDHQALLQALVADAAEPA